MTGKGTKKIMPLNSTGGTKYRDGVRVDKDGDTLETKDSGGRLDLPSALCRSCCITTLCLALFRITSLPTESHLSSHI